MSTKVRKRGHSLWIPIPGEIANAMQFKEGSKIVLRTIKGEIQVRLAPPKK
jgi:antitoxin component of MazEF toxin-antitoxin module